MKKLGLVFAIFFNIFIVYGEIFGIVHSVKKHSTGDNIASIVIPPWAWFRSIEMWWHDDYANVDWDKRLTNDMQTCIYFISQANNPEINKFELNENLEKFSNKINKYPKDKLDFLLNGSRNYIEFTNSLSVDFMDAMKLYYVSGDFEWKYSEKSKLLEKSLSKYKLEEDITLAKKTLNELVKKLKENLPEDELSFNNEQIDNLVANGKLKLEVQQKENKRIFKSLFNQEL